MDFMKQLQLMEKLSPFADEIINNYNERICEFTPSNEAVFDEHSEVILEIVGGVGIEAKYKDGKIFIEFN